MKKKIFWALLIVCALVFVLAISASAAEMANYCTVKLTLTNGETVTAYCGISGEQVQRDSLYKTPDSAGEKYSWEDVVVFDCRGQTVVGSNMPRSYAGTGCNALAKNVTTVYLSEYNTYLLNSSFTSQWSSLETVYVSSSMTSIGGFAGAPLKNVVIAENSQLQKISGSAFSGCNKLESINLGDCADLKSIDDRAFQGCTSLTSVDFPESLESIGYNGFYSSGLSGTVVVPNSVTNLGPGSFLNTNIETLILGDGPVTIGHNFTGAHLKNIYIPAEATFTQDNIFYNGSSLANFYIVGDDCTAVNDALLYQSANTNNSYMKFVMAEDATESTGAGYGIIHTGYNRCEVFYGSHSFTGENLPFCTVTCDVCGINYNGEDAKHSYELLESYTGEKYLSPCTVSQVCSVCEKTGKVTEIGAIVAWLGYSVTEQPIGGVFGISQSFYVNVDALSAYEELTGNTLEYGVVAAGGANLSPLYIENGQLVASAGALSYSMKGINCFEIKISGIKETDFDKAVVFNGYVSNGTAICYISGDTTTDAPVPLSYNQIKAN